VIHCEVLFNRLRESWYAWFDLGRFYTKKKNLPAAINAYKKAVEINPEYAEA
jgi:tetratricopeptide (TPR) repeat protein